MKRLRKEGVFRETRKTPWRAGGVGEAKIKFIKDSWSPQGEDIIVISKISENTGKTVTTKKGRKSLF